MYLSQRTPGREVKLPEKQLDISSVLCGVAEPGQLEASAEALPGCHRCRGGKLEPGELRASPFWASPAHSNSKGFSKEFLLVHR